MAGIITKGDIELLSYITEYKFLTVKQLVALSRRNRQSIGRRRRFLENEGLITRYDRGSREENLIYLTAVGMQFLHGEGIIPEPQKNVTEHTILNMQVEHDLLVNWFHIHLVHIEKTIPRLIAQFVNLSFRRSDGSEPLKKIYIPKFKTDNNREIELIPDGIFIFTDKETKRSFLFFLEVDMGSEALKGGADNFNTIEKKIVKYQLMFRDELYKKYEAYFRAKFNGFRLLFLSNTPDRLSGLCRTVREMPPSDFIWLTEQNKMFARGLSSDIWFRGGKVDTPKQSILGSLACDTPVIQ